MMLIRGLLLLALIASCKKGPSCADQKREASEVIRAARLLANDTTAEQKAFDEATTRLEELRAFQVKLTAGISEARSTAGCDPDLICCKKAADWIAANAAVAEDAQPTFRLPVFGANASAPPEGMKHLAAYDAGAGNLAVALQRTDATVEDVTAACTAAATALGQARSAAMTTITPAVEQAEADRAATKQALAVANDRATIYLAMEDSIAKNAKFDVPNPSPTEPAKFTEAKAKAKAIQSCLK